MQTFGTILQYFISTVYNTVSLAQHITDGPVRDIMGITFAVVQVSPLTICPLAFVPAIWGGGGGRDPPCVNAKENSVFFVLCCFQQDKCCSTSRIHLLASLFLQFEKFYVKLSVCFCLISVKVSEFIYLEIYVRKQLRRTQKEYKV